MILGFDAKRYFHNRTGLGNYSRTLLQNLHRFYPENEYHLYTPKIKSADQGSPEFRIHENAKWPAAFWRSYSMSNDWKAQELQVYHGLSNELPLRNFTEAKTVLTVHDLIFKRLLSTYPFLDRAIYDYKLRASFSYSDQIIAISEQTKADISTYYEIDPSEIKVLYQAVGEVFYQEESDALPIVTNYQLPLEYILCVGTFQTRKNQLQILKAWRALPKTLQLPIVLVGNGKSYQKKLQNFAQTHKIPLHCLTEVTDDRVLKTLYQKASVFVYPSLYEGFGLPIVEALLSGVPVITSTVSAMPEAGGPMSQYVDPLNTEELAYRLQAVLEDTVLRKQMVLEGRRYALSIFDPQKLSEDLMGIYRSVV